jgi:hypothetical protein
MQKSSMMHEKLLTLLTNFHFGPLLLSIDSMALLPASKHLSQSEFPRAILDFH